MKLGSIFCNNQIRRKALRKKFDPSNWTAASEKWHLCTSPFIPSEDDITHYCEEIGHPSNESNILLLGSTSEIRCKLSECSDTYFVVDASYPMLHGMLRFGKTIDEKKERWIKTNWLDLHKFMQNDYFDIILGDLILRNIDYDEQNNLLISIHKLLRKNGRFISRIHFINEEVAEKTVAGIVNATVQEAALLHTNKLNIIEDTTVSRLFDKYTNYKTNTIDRCALEKDLLFCIEKSEIDEWIKLILFNIRNRWQANGRTWVQHTQERLVSVLRNVFDVSHVRIANDYIDTRYYPIYILKK